MNNHYHYVQCGLGHIWLANGFTREETPYGPAVRIENADALDRAIAKHLTEKPSPLSGDELRFLRQMLDMSQKRLGELAGGKQAQTVAIWEKSSRVNDDVDFLVRHIYRQAAINEREGYVELVDFLNAQDRQEHAQRLIFSETPNGWEGSVAA